MSINRRNALVCLIASAIILPLPGIADPVAAPSTATTLPPNDVADLNTAFRYTVQNVQDIIKKGQEVAKKGENFGDFARSYAQMPRGVRGEKGKSHQSAVYCQDINGLTLINKAYKSAINYVPLDFPDEWIKIGCHPSRVQFRVILNSVPQVAADVLGRNRTANEDDVTVTKFVLTDDLGHIINPVSSTIVGASQGMENFGGVATIPHTSTEHTDASATVTASGPGGFASAQGTGQATTTYNYTEFIPWSVSHPYFSATYNVSFPLFDSSGKPTIPKEAKSMTLHIITPNGEKVVDYDLKPPKI